MDKKPHSGSSRSFPYRSGAFVTALAVGFGLRFAVNLSPGRTPAVRRAQRAAMSAVEDSSAGAKNVLGTELGCCCTSPVTGFYRDGYCKTGPMDTGRHVVCARLTSAFLEFTKSRGNDLSTPMPEYNFPGLKDGDKWCLCALRWKEALEAGVAPPVVLACTNEKVLDYVRMEDLQAHALSE